MVMAPKKSDGVNSGAHDFQQQSIRFAPQHIAWLSAESKRTGESFNSVVRQLVDDARSFYGLSPTIADLLEEERATMGLDFRRYVQEVLTQRYANLLRADIEDRRSGGGRPARK
jgi:hypothetical protein